MGKSTTSSGLGRGRISKPALGAAISGVVAILLAALLHANSLAVGYFIDDSSALAESEAALVTTQLSLRNLSQAVLLAEDVTLGVADRDTAAAAAAEAGRVVDDLETRIAGLDTGPSSELAISRARDVIALLESGDVAAAGALLAGDTLAAYENLRDGVAATRDESLDTLNNAQGLSQKIGTIAGFVIALLAPALAIFAYWRIARRQLDTARVEMDSRLEAERRVIHAKDEFISSISHELRTPLTSIYGFSEILIEQGLIDPQEAHTLISVINEESAELNRMVEDLLTVARQEAGTIAFNTETLDLAEELSVVARPMQRTGLDIEVACPPMTVEADQLRTRQIVRNLLSNAQKWGGNKIIVTAHQIGATAVITVADDGPGVPVEDEQRLFKRYMHEGDSALTTGSIGLGLAVVRILAEGMSGEVRYERADGWTRFVVYLPTRSAEKELLPQIPPTEQLAAEVA